MDGSAQDKGITLPINELRPVDSPMKVNPNRNFVALGCYRASP